MDIRFPSARLTSLSKDSKTNQQIANPRFKYFSIKLYSNERYGNDFTSSKAYDKVQKVNLCK